MKRAQLSLVTLPAHMGCMRYLRMGFSALIKLMKTMPKMNVGMAMMTQSVRRRRVRLRSCACIWHARSSIVGGWKIEGVKTGFRLEIVEKICRMVKVGGPGTYRMCRIGFSRDIGGSSSTNVCWSAKASRSPCMIFGGQCSQNIPSMRTATVRSIASVVGMPSGIIWSSVAV